MYVLVPGGDFKKDKTILGAVKKLGDDYITMLGDDAYDIIGRNICTLNHAEFCSYEAINSDPLPEGFGSWVDEHGK